MKMLDDQPPRRSSLQVAPLSISKHRDGSASHDSPEHEEAPASGRHRAQSDYTPPITPSSSQEKLITQPAPPPPPPPPPAIFHNFLRAFYPFHPTYAMSDSTVTLPLNEGDVVLVHSIHTNGWADGTLLLSGARGWLPTNYCDAYDPEEMRNLLKALLNFWDLLRSTATNDQDIFGNQEFMKGIIAGVRYLLEKTNCLTRESALIQRNEILRRSRKSLLSELSSLVKTAKRLQEMLRTFPQVTEEINDVIDEMILKAFKIVVKGVRFLDLLDEDRRSRAPAVTVMATVVEESYIPPTPPAESAEFENHQGDNPNAGSPAELHDAPGDGLAPSSSEGVQTNGLAHRRLSAVCSSNRASYRLSQSNESQGGRLSASISHRVSLAGPSPTTAHPQSLVSERLNSSHDTFLSYLGSFIGRLHLQSQSRPDLAQAIKQSATAGAQLLAVVDAVCNHNALVSEKLELAHTAMYDCIRDMVLWAREILSNEGPDGEDVIMPQDNGRLLGAATSCVKSAGECVAKAKWVIERVGDFEIEGEGGDLGLDLSVFDAVTESRPRTPPHRSSVIESNASDSPSVPARSVASSMDKPLPQIPVAATETSDVPTVKGVSPPPSRRQSIVTDAESNTESTAESTTESAVSSIRRPSVPSLSKLTTSLMRTDGYDSAEVAHDDSEYHTSFRSDTLTASSAGTSSTYMSRDSESSMVSATSTRATTPDINLMPKPQPSLSSLSATGSAGTNDEVDDVENKLMEKTFAHELIFNKEGQVTGGSLPALVERLTTHESTPDAIFVSTFYLTFRLFCTPVKLVEVLIDRFDYIGEAPHISNPVRLRVYNVMKGWLESHWRNASDQDVLPLIQDFAKLKLAPVLPTAGKRLAELAQRVSTTDCLLVPRLMSSMTKTSAPQYVPADTPLPLLLLHKTQVNLLNIWKAGGTSPSFLDFHPVEIARQLTLKQMSIFCAIMPEELLGSQWMKKGGVYSPNVKAMSAFSTDLSNLVAETILLYSEVKKRAAVIKQWIKIAHQCFELNNYDGLMAIICSLNSSIISRLRKTWDVISPKRREMLSALQAIVEPSNNNKVLRARLQGHIPPCLPFLGMFLTDLTFVDIGNPATKQVPSPDGTELTIVNFDKHSRTAKIIGELQRFQVPYRLTEVPDMQDWMQAEIMRVKKAEQGNVQVSYYRKSLLLEPRETALRGPLTDGSATPSGQKTDLFGWISRDRHNHNNNTNNSHNNSNNATNTVVAV